MEFEIQPATADDCNDIVELFEAYRVFYRQAPQGDAAAAFIRERFAKADSQLFIARATADHAAVGFMQLYPIFSSTRMARAWILNDLFVIPAWRRRGVGRQLLLRARDFGNETGAVEMSLETAVDNFPAQAAYESLGWERERAFYKFNLRLR